MLALVCSSQMAICKCKQMNFLVFNNYLGLQGPGWQDSSLDSKYFKSPHSFPFKQWMKNRSIDWKTFKDWVDGILPFKLFMPLQVGKLENRYITKVCLYICKWLERANGFDILDFSLHLLALSSFLPFRAVCRCKQTKSVETINEWLADLKPDA